MLFIIEIPDGYHYKKLTTDLTLYNYKDNIETMINEQEYIVLPNSYYVIVDIFTIVNDVKIIKLRMIRQDYYQMKNNTLHYPEIIYPQPHELKNFESEEISNFIKLCYQYEKMINELNLLKSYEINNKLYLELVNSDQDNLFDLDIDLIETISKEIDESNKLEKLYEIKKLGFGYTDYDITHINYYLESIKMIKFIKQMEFKSIKKLKVYSGYFNSNELFEKPPFIELIKKQKIYEEFEYYKILIGQMNCEKFLYNNIYYLDYPYKKIKKNNKTKLLYYKHLIEYNMENTKICVCSKHHLERYNNIILIPNFKMKITEIKKCKNKYNLSYILYKINITNI